MSMYLNFEPHSWYMGFAIKDDRTNTTEECNWTADTVDGMSGYIETFYADTLDEIKAQIRHWHLCKHDGYGERIAKKRLEYLRGELRAERISYDELAELQSLSDYIEDGDVELLAAAGLPEGSE